MDGGLGHCTGSSDQDHLQEKEIQKGKMAAWAGLTNSQGWGSLLAAVYDVTQSRTRLK